MSRFNQSFHYYIWNYKHIIQNIHINILHVCKCKSPYYEITCFIHDRTTACLNLFTHVCIYFRIYNEQKSIYYCELKVSSRRTTTYPSPFLNLRMHIAWFNLGNESWVSSQGCILQRSIERIQSLQISCVPLICRIVGYWCNFFKFKISSCCFDTIVYSWVVASIKTLL